MTDTTTDEKSHPAAIFTTHRRAPRFMKIIRLKQKKASDCTYLLHMNTFPLSCNTHWQTGNMSLSHSHMSMLWKWRRQTTSELVTHLGRSEHAMLLKSIPEERENMSNEHWLQLNDVFLKYTSFRPRFTRSQQVLPSVVSPKSL